MKHKLIISLLLLSGPLVLNGCSASSETASEESSEPAVTDTTAETETTVTETTRRPPEDYVHGEDGYYCLKDVTDADIKEVLGINFNPNNCCIKALYAKE